MTPAAVLSGAARWTVVEGDCLAILPTLPDRCVAHVITDPPYSDKTSKNARKCNRGEALEKTRSYITFAGVDGLEARIAGESVRVAARWAVLFCALEQLGAYAASAGASWVRSTIWLRTNSAPQFTGDRPGQAAEGVAILHRKGRKRWNRGGCAAAWVGPTANSMGDAQRGSLGHPTPKPEWLMLDVIDAFTDPGDIILDPFAGSGTTGVAALRLGRRFIGIEREPKYVAIARERLEAEERGSTLQAARAGQTTIFDRIGGAK